MTRNGGSIGWQKAPKQLERPLSCSPSLAYGTFASLFKLVSWYDNEWGYSNKCLEMLRVVAK
jgi:hypothetical protein